MTKYFPSANHLCSGHSWFWNGVYLLWKKWSCKMCLYLHALHAKLFSASNRICCKNLLFWLLPGSCSPQIWCLYSELEQCIKILIMPKQLSYFSLLFMSIRKTWLRQACRIWPRAWNTNTGCRNLSSKKAEIHEAGPKQKGEPAALGCAGPLQLLVFSAILSAPTPLTQPTPLGFEHLRLSFTWIA